MRRLAVLLALAAAAPGPAAAAPSPAVSGTLRIALYSEPTNLNPIFQSRLVEQWISRLVFRHLWWWDDAGRWIPDLVESVPTTENGGISKDGKKIRFKLRSGVRWHDGTQLTVADVRFTLETCRTADGSPFHGPLSAIASIETPDDSTVVLTLSRAYAPLLSNIPAIAPKHRLEGTKDWSRDPFASEPLGCGPFAFVAWSAGSHIELERRAPQPKGTPGPRKLILRFVPDENNRLVQLKSGETDLVRLDAPEHVVAGKRVTTAATTPHDPLKLVYVAINNDRPVLADLRVRRALHHATDKTAILRDIYGNCGTAANGPVPPALWCFRKTESPAYDPGKARALLDEAGWKEDDDGIRRRKGKRLALGLTVMAEDKMLNRLAVVLQQAYRVAGVDITIRGIPAAKFYALPAQGGEFLAGEYDLAASVYYYSGSPDFPDTQWMSGEIGVNNSSRYRQATVDRLLAEAAGTVDRRKSSELYGQVQQILAADTPVVPILWQHSLWAHSPRLKHFRPGPISDAFWNAAEWQF